MTPQEEDNFKSHGWYSHFVLPEKSGQRWVNYHTHGLPEHYGHLDFQIVLPIDPGVLHALAGTLVDRVKKGERFTAGMRVSDVMDNYDVLLAKTAETRSDRRSVLRVILPNNKGPLDKLGLAESSAHNFKNYPIDYLSCLGNRHGRLTR